LAGSGGFESAAEVEPTGAEVLGEEFAFYDVCFVSIVVVVEQEETEARSSNQ
jgi:hypothetical protein